MSVNPVALPGEPVVNLEQALANGLSEAEFALIERRLERTPTFTELGVFSVMWSEHCSYKSSRRHLARLPNKSSLVAGGPGENAGALDIGDGWLAVFKIESHNHPAFVEPYQGAATAGGGICREIFALGARRRAIRDCRKAGAFAAPHLLRFQGVRGVGRGG